MQINKIGLDKAEILGKIENEVYTNGGQWTGEMFLTDMSQNNRIYLAAEQDGEVMAFVCASYFLDDADILRVATLPKYQRRGIATKLMLTVLDSLKELSVKKVMLEVEEDNIGAQKLYQKVGFKEISKRKNYYKNGKTGLIYLLEF